MEHFDWGKLQLFAGEGEAAQESGEATPQQRLEALGVPANKLKSRAKGAQAPGQAAAAPDTGAGRMSWEQIMADPEYNKQMQAVVKSRLKEAKASQEAMQTLAPALEALARKHSLDPGNIDYAALAQAVSREQVPAQRPFEPHYRKMEQEARELQRVFPGFDLQEELKNPAFVRLTAPHVGVSVEDAYFALHRKELQAAAMQVTAQKTAQKLSNSIQAGGIRPAENGTSGQAPSVTTFDYRTASREQKEALKKRILDEAARGRKVYPGELG